MEFSENKIFDIATKFIQYTDSSIFLTGKAGTGKTTFLHYIKNNISKKMAIVAPTGVAAINAGGVTIHSFFNLPFGLFIPNFITYWNQNESNIINKEQLIKRLKFNSNKRIVIKELELLIIDEVSMARVDTIDAIDTILRHVRKQPTKPFGGVQVIFIGDLYQLPPVIKDQDAQLMEEHYESPFFFHAKVLKQHPPIFIELEKIYRQQDATFIELLNNIRNNTCTPRDFELLNNHYQPTFNVTNNEKYITLCSHNYLADDINKTELQKLPTNPIIFKATIEGDFPENAYPTDASINLKVGAQIMFIKNDKGENRRFYNGKIAEIKAIDIDNNQITVAFENDKNLLVVERETWNNVKYEFNKEQQQIEEVILGSFIQFPIRLAWAITIHKSQGLTFDKAIIDASKAFAPGQVYVALSRLTNLAGLVLKSTIPPQAIKTDERITSFNENKLPEDELFSVLEFEQTKYIKQFIIDVFNFDKVIYLFEQLSTDYSNTTFFNLDTIQDQILAIQDDLKRIQITALQFQQQLHNYIKPIHINYSELLNRVEKGQSWFKDQIENKLIAAINEHIKYVNTISKTKKYFKDLQFILSTLKNNTISFDVAAFYILGLQNNIQPDKLIQTALQQFYKQSKTELQPSNDYSKLKSNEITLQMYNEGMSVDEIAAKRNIISSTVQSHLISFIKTGEISVYNYVDEHSYTIIKQCIENNPTLKLGELKIVLGENFSYDSIKAVLEDLKRIS